LAFGSGQANMVLRCSPCDSVLRTRLGRGVGWLRLVAVAVFALTLALVFTTVASALSVGPVPGSHVAAGEVPAFAVDWEPGAMYYGGSFVVMNEYGVEVGGCSVLAQPGTTTECRMASVLPPGTYSWTFVYSFPFCVDDPASGRICAPRPASSSYGPHLLTVDFPLAWSPPVLAVGTVAGDQSPRSIAAAPTLPARARFTGVRSIKNTRLTQLVYKTLKGVVGKPRLLAVGCWTTNDFEAVSGGSVAGGNVTLAFWSSRQPRWLHISGDACDDFQRLLDTGTPNGRRASSVVTALHEATHAYGIGDEAQANCYAVQLVPLAGRKLGMSETQAAYLGRLGLNYTRRTAPRAYWDATDCRNGGTWDLGLGTVKL
jgi:hypothetical protein